MNKTLNFFKRNFKEILRDPMIYIFCLGFPIVLLILFQVINKYTEGNTPMFELPSLLPSIILFSYTFVMLTLALTVSKDRQTFFLKRLYSSPMKAHHFILGYSFVGFAIGLFQTFVCIAAGFAVSKISSAEFISLGEALLLAVSQLPLLITNLFLGIFIGTVFNDKAAPGICSIFISVTGVLGGCWMPIETMGDFERFCRCLPFYPSVNIGRAVTGAVDGLGGVYSFDAVTRLGLIPIAVFLVGSVVLSVVAFRKTMVSDQ